MNLTPPSGLRIHFGEDETDYDADRCTSLVA
jgi:hypothetical protein